MYIVFTKILIFSKLLQFNGEIISADSRQVYKYMDIGTGKVYLLKNVASGPTGSKTNFAIRHADSSAATPELSPMTPPPIQIPMRTANNPVAPGVLVRLALDCRRVRSVAYARPLHPRRNRQNSLAQKRTKRLPVFS